MCKPTLSTQLIPIRKSTQTRSTSVSGQISGTSTSFTTSTILQLSKLNVERDLPTHFNTNYTGDVNGHSPLCGYHDHNSATWHLIEDMFTKQPHIYVGRDNDSHIVSPIHWYDEHTRPKPSICRHCEQNTSTLFEKTSEEITDQHSSNSLTEQCNLNMHGYIEGTTMTETGLSSAKYQINRYKACSSEHALTRTTE